MIVGIVSGARFPQMVHQDRQLPGHRHHRTSSFFPPRCAIYYHSAYVEIGGLITYSVEYAQRYRRAATYADRILKGAKPANLPVERLTKFVLEINLRTANQLGITIPSSILCRADKVIK